MRKMSYKDSTPWAGPNYTKNFCRPSALELLKDHFFKKTNKCGSLTTIDIFNSMCYVVYDPQIAYLF